MKYEEGTRVRVSREGTWWHGECRRVVGYDKYGIVYVQLVGGQVQPFYTDELVIPGGRRPVIV